MLAHDLEVQTAGDEAVVRLTDHSFTEENLPALGEQLSCLVDGQGRRRLRLDFGAVRYVPSLGLAKLVALHRKVRGAGGHLTLAGLDPAVYEVFRATNLHKVLDVRPQGAE
jgi:anti-anti-sigma factor